MRHQIIKYKSANFLKLLEHVRFSSRVEMIHLAQKYEEIFTLSISICLCLLLETPFLVAWRHVIKERNADIG